MQRLSLDDPDWLATFPRRVAPLQDEWLPGLLLRCDEMNHWASKTTLHYLLRLGPEQFHRCWYAETPNLAVIPHFALNMEYTTKLMMISSSALLTTTYHVELARCYDNYQPHSKYLTPSLTFRLCPECIEKERILRRTLILPHIALCPLHQVTLLERCRCGTSLRLFPRQTQPFTCQACGLDWGNLPRISASPEQVVKGQRLLSWYQLFFSRGSPSMLKHAIAYVDEKEKKKVHYIAGKPLMKKEIEGSFRKTRSGQVSRYSWEPLALGTLVGWLMERDLSVSDFTPYNAAERHSDFVCC